MDLSIHLNHPSAVQYDKLLKYEQQLDGLIARRRGFECTFPVSLRLFVSHEVDVSNHSWTLKIEGRVLDADKSLPSEFSHYLKGLVIEFKHIPAVEWFKTKDSLPCDGFEIKKSGKDEVAKIFVHLDHGPGKFTVDGRLAALLDISTPETKENLIQKLWSYVKINKLHDTEDKRVINCDIPLAQIFGQPKIMLPQVPEHLPRLMQPIEPIIIEYPITSTPKQLKYDVQVDQIVEFNPKTNDEEIQQLNQRLSNVLRELDNSRRRKEMFESFAENPIQFMNKWMSSQSKDLATIQVDGSVNVEEIRSSDYYRDPMIEQAILHRLGQPR